MRILSAILFLLFSVYYASARAAQTAPPKVKTAETRKQQAVVSKSLYAKLKAQAMAEARAELAREEETRERAKLEALKELDAGAGEVSDETGN